MKKVCSITASILVLLTLTLFAQQKQDSVPDCSKYVPYNKRTGNESVVYFTRDLSANGLIRAYEQVNGNNLLAQDYEFNLDYPMPHATFMGGVNFQF